MVLIIWIGDEQRARGYPCYLIEEFEERGFAWPYSRKAVCSHRETPLFGPLDGWTQKVGSLEGFFGAKSHRLGFSTNVSELPENAFVIAKSVLGAPGEGAADDRMST